MKYIIAVALAMCLFPVFAQAGSEDDYLKQLAWCESQGNDNVVVYDPPRNPIDSLDIYSYGRYQFKVRTLHQFAKLYGIFPKEFTLQDTKLMMLNVGVQSEVARRMIADGLTHHWRNCANAIASGKVRRSMIG